MLGFGGDRLEAKRKGRRVEELYNATDIIDEAEARIEFLIRVLFILYKVI